MPIRWTDTDPLGSFERTHTRDGQPSTIDVEAYRLSSMAPAFGLLLIVLAAVILAGWVGLHDQCARLTRDGATATVLHTHGCQP